MAKIVREKKSRKMPDLESAEEQLQTLQNLTLCVQIPFPNPKAYMNFCKHYQNDVQNFLSQSDMSDYIKYTAYFPVENFQLIQEKYKRDAAFKLRSNTALVILLFKKEININDQIKKKIQHQLVQYLISFRGPKGKGFNPSNENYFPSHKKEEYQESIEESKIFEINLGDFYLYSKREIYNTIICKHFAKFFSEKRIYSSFHERPLILKTIGDESTRQVLTFETTQKVFNSFSDWIKNLISQITITEDLISLDKSVTILKHHENKEFLRNYIDNHLVPKEYFKPPLLVLIGNIEERGSILDIRLFLVISGFHINDPDKIDYDVIKQEMSGKVKEKLTSFITQPLKDSKDLDIIKGKFDENLWRNGANSYYLLGDKSRIKEIQDFLSKNAEEEIVTLSFKLKTDREIFVVKSRDQNDFKEYEGEGLIIDLIGKDIIQFKGKKKIALKFNDFLNTYLKNKEKLLTISTKNWIDSLEKDFGINNDKKPSILSRRHLGKLKNFLVYFFFTSKITPSFY